MPERAVVYLDNDLIASVERDLGRRLRDPSNKGISKVVNCRLRQYDEWQRQIDDGELVRISPITRDVVDRMKIDRSVREDEHADERVIDLLVIAGSDRLFGKDP